MQMVQGSLKKAITKKYDESRKSVTPGKTTPGKSTPGGEKRAVNDIDMTKSMMNKSELKEVPEEQIQPIMSPRSNASKTKTIDIQKVPTPIPLVDIKSKSS